MNDNCKNLVLAVHQLEIFILNHGKCVCTGRTFPRRRGFIHSPDCPMLEIIKYKSLLVQSENDDPFAPGEYEGCC